MFFNYNNVNMNIIRIFFILLAVMSLYSIGVEGCIQLLITIPAVILAICVHEFAHAFMATKFGDNTPREQGRLSLNPVAHLDFFGTILMLFSHIGWGKPVQINPNNFESKRSKEYCITMVALAGPIMNFICAFISMIIYSLLIYFQPSFIQGNIGSVIETFLYFFIVVNIGQGTFNLLPLPPLDGEKIFRNILPYKAKAWLDANYYTLYVIFMFLWFFGILEIVVSPVIGVIYNGMANLVTNLLSLII